MVRLNHFGQEANDTARGIKLAALLSLGSGKFPEEILINPPKSVVIRAGRNLGDAFEQFLEEGAGEKIVSTLG